MAAHYGVIEETGLQFFGQMSASVTHELKNALAIINENAGLLEDLVMMANQGMPLSGERASSIAERIKKQVKRADGVTSKMNRFAHSVDHFSERLDLNDVLSLVLEMGDRLIQIREKTVAVDSPPGNVVVRTISFYLMNLVWRCLLFSMENCDKTNNINLKLEPVPEGAKIYFTGLKKTIDTPVPDFPTRSELDLVKLLEGKVSVDPENGVIVLFLPENCNH